jgi:quercetin dioxygenase-like cupin family protein
MNSTYTSDLAALIPNIPPDSIVSRTLFDEDHLKVLVFGFAAGQELSEHTSSKAAVLHFLSGEASVTLDDETKEARAGTWIHMTPRLPHSVSAKTPVVMILMLLKS